MVVGLGVVRGGDPVAGEPVPPGAPTPGEFVPGALAPGPETPGAPVLPGLTLENGDALRPTDDDAPVDGALPPPPPPINAVEKPVPESTTCGICPPPGKVGFVITGFVSVGANAR
jgi:hypothetical protein